MKIGMPARSLQWKLRSGMLFPLALALSLTIQATPASASPPDPGQEQGAAGVPAGTASVPRVRLPLLREGTYLTSAKGAVVYDGSIGTWAFIIDEGPDAGEPRRIILLPSRVVEDMLHSVSGADDRLYFELTGRLLVYDGMNFIIPTFASPLADVSASGGEAAPVEATPVEASDPGSEAPTNTLDSSGDDVARRLEERLQARIGALPRSSDSGTRRSDVETLTEGTRLQNRRGSIVRDQRSGTWRFVFDAVGSGPVDPTMELLPCLALERLQRAAAISDLPAAVLLSGEVTSFRGRNYLLPTLWRVAGEDRNLIP